METEERPKPPHPPLPTTPPVIQPNYYLSSVNKPPPLDLVLVQTHLNDLPVLVPDAFDLLRAHVKTEVGVALDRLRVNHNLAVVDVQHVWVEVETLLLAGGDVRIQALRMVRMGKTKAK